MKSIILRGKLLIIYILLINIVNAQEIIKVLWEKNIPNYKKSDETEVIEETDRLIFIKYVQNPTITLYSPAKGNSTGQAVIIAPGGGYWGLAYDWEGTDIAKWLNSKGITGIVLKYRLPVSKSNVVCYKPPLLDIQRAIRMARYYAADWNIDPHKIGVMGFSAGGHLASTAGTHFDYGNKDAEDIIDRQSCRPDFMILVYPVISFSNKYGHKGSSDALLGKFKSDNLIKYFSNELQVKDDTPPTILIHAEDDDAVPVENSLLFFGALKEKNIPAEMHIYPYGGHGFSLAIGQGRLSSWTDRCIDWLNALNNEKK